MDRRKFLVLLAILAFTLLSVQTAGADLMTNGGFETGDFTGWTRSGNMGFTGVSTSEPHSGIYSASFGPVGSDGYITQNIATTPGAQYGLDFWLKSDGGTHNDYNVTWGAQTLVSQTNLGSFGWTEYQYSVVAAGASTALTFGFRQDPAYFHLDDVSLRATSSVPEPCSMLFLGAGLVGLVGFRKKLKK
jgi:hypothetical protein